MWGGTCLLLTYVSYVGGLTRTYFFRGARLGNLPSSFIRRICGFIETLTEFIAMHTIIRVVYECVGVYTLYVHWPSQCTVHNFVRTENSRSSSSACLRHKKKELGHNTINNRSYIERCRQADRKYLCAKGVEGTEPFAPRMSLTSITTQVLIIGIPDEDTP